MSSPSESYPFYSVPGCPPLTDHPLESQPESFGALLEADTLTDTGIRFRFKQEQQAQKVCQFKITERESYEQLLYMVRNHYWYHMVLDELPIFGMSGEFITEEEMKVELAELAAAAAGVAGGVDVKTPSSSDILTGSTTPGAQGFIYTHKDFSISYNGRQIIEVNLTSENPRPIVMGETYPMTYSVTWISTEQSFETRFNRYLDFDFFEHQIHWFSIMNSFMLVVFLCGLVLLILSRTIKTSINSGFSDPESPTMSTISNNAGDEIGFKLLVGDVFRAPNHLLLYSVLLGTGVQLFLLISAALVLALAVTYYDESRGLLISAFLIFYSLTSGVQGYITGWHYKLHGGISWKRAMWLGVFMYPAILLTLLCLLNTIAITFGSHGLLSIPTTLMLTLIWACVSVPLTIAGTILARQHTQPGAFPCRVNAIRRLIPSENVGNASLPNNPNSSANQWYTNYWLLIVMSGILPFGSVFIEIYFVRRDTHSETTQARTLAHDPVSELDSLSLSLFSRSSPVSGITSITSFMVS